jgi:low temperature requirement protein LtrA
MLVLAAVWWAWAAYAWLTNQVDPNESKVRLPVFAAMGAMLVASLAVPGAFEDSALLFAIAYLVVRVLHIIVFAEASDDVEVMAAVRAMAPTALLAPALLIVAAFLDGPAQVALWVVALVIDYGGAGVRGIEGWHLSPGHFAERHGLIMIIALGESIVLTGATTADSGLDTATVVSFGLAFLGTAALWWLYFNYVATIAQRRLALAEDSTRLARAAYTSLHALIIAGVILSAVGNELVIAHPTDELPAPEVLAVVAGPALYLLAHVALRLRMTGTISGKRLAGALACLAVGAVGAFAPAVVLAALLVAVLAGVIAWEQVATTRRRARGEPSPMERLETSAAR